MASTAITAAATTSNANASNASASASAGTKLAGDMQSFLKLLTTQLKNQDPTNPTDSSQFTTQLAQFSAVEQQIATNSHLESLLSLQQSSSMLSATSLVGRSVEVSGDRLVLKDGKTQGISLPGLANAGGASSAVITISNSSGVAVRQETVTLGAESGSWSWNGKDALGRSLSDGKYTVAVAGADSRGSSTGSLTPALTGTVNSVTRTNGDPTMSIGGLNVGLDALLGLK